MSATDRSMRADARRSHDAILAAAGALFAGRGGEVQMDEIAERAGVGMGTLYRHFATKQALLAAIIGRRFVAMIDLAHAAEQVADPGASSRRSCAATSRPLSAMSRSVTPSSGPEDSLGRDRRAEGCVRRGRAATSDAQSTPATCEVT